MVTGESAIVYETYPDVEDRGVVVVILRLRKVIGNAVEWWVGSTKMVGVGIMKLEEAWMLSGDEAC